MLKRLYVDNYKCLVNFELQMDQLVILLGANGAGKSAVLDVITALRNVLSGRPKLNDPDAFPGDTLTRWQSRQTQVFELDIDTPATGELTYRLEVEHSPEEQRAWVRLERLSTPTGMLFDFRNGKVQLYRADHTHGPAFSGDWSQSWLARFTSRKDNPRPGEFLEYISGLVVCGLYPPAMAAESRGEEVVLARDGSNFSAWYRNMIQERPDLSHRLTEALVDVLPGFQGLRMERVGADARVLKAVFNHEGRYELQFDQLSDGQRAIVLLYALLFLHQDAGQTLLLDEPDNYLALAEIQPWLMAVSDAVGGGLSQVILCTHHPEVIDYLGARHGLLLGREGAGPTRVRRVDDLTEESPITLSETIARGWEA